MRLDVVDITLELRLVAVLSDTEHVVKEPAAGAAPAVARAASQGSVLDDGGVAALVNELVEQWRAQLAELSVKY